MDQSSQPPASSLTLKNLLQELENLIELESQRKGSPWSSAAKLTELFYEKYGVFPEDMAKAQGYAKDLRSLLKSSGRFSIYSTQIPQEFYVTLLKVVVPKSPQSQQTARHPIHYRIKRSWKVDGRLIEWLKAENAQELRNYQPRKVPDYQVNLISNIESVDDLKLALIEIVRSLTADNPKNFVTITHLSRKFCDYYKQPIKSVLRSVCPGIKLVNLLQTIPNLRVQKVDDNWQITVNIHSVK